MHERCKGTISLGCPGGLPGENGSHPVEAKENGYHRIPIKEVDQESMGSEMRDLHTFALGDACV